MSKSIKNILILCDMDAFANAIRPLEMKKYLEKKGHTVTIVNGETIYLHTERSVKKNRSTFKYKYSQIVMNKALYYFDLYVNGWPYYFYFKMKLRKRSFALKKIIDNNKYDTIICMNHVSAYVTRYELNSKVILDLDAPLIDELWLTGKLTKASYRKLIDEYKKIYRKAAHINFQWHMYSKYVQKNVYNGDNFIEINFGSTRKNSSLRPLYTPNPRIICLGFLGGKWVNLPLLSALSKLYPIDVYGGPAPDKKWKINYKGYAPSTDIIKNYQFGLITISKDKLRRSSFSSKHLEYLSYGLPVLTPDWRKDFLLEDVSIYYNQSNFLTVIKKYQSKATWSKMSDLCYNRAKDFEWDKVLRPLERVI